MRYDQHNSKRSRLQITNRKAVNPINMVAEQRGSKGVRIVKPRRTRTYFDK